jgi:hypothetical protein
MLVDSFLGLGGTAGGTFVLEGSIVAFAVGGDRGGAGFPGGSRGGSLRGCMGAWVIIFEPVGDSSRSTGCSFCMLVWIIGETGSFDLFEVLEIEESLRRGGGRICL